MALVNPINRFGDAPHYGFIKNLKIRVCVPLCHSVTHSVYAGMGGSLWGCDAPERG